MARDRFIPCKSYVAEKNCKRGKEGTFYIACQKCPFYDPVRGAKPAKTDHRRKDLDKIRKREVY